MDPPRAPWMGAIVDAQWFDSTDRHVTKPLGRLRESTVEYQDELKSSGIFDKFAAFTGMHLSRAWFFSASVISVIVWAISGPVFKFSEGWQLVINTGTTILTFLLVALIQNTQERTTKALHHKLDAIAIAVAYILEDTGSKDGDNKSDEFIQELRRIAGVSMEASE